MKEFTKESGGIQDAGLDCGRHDEFHGLAKGWIMAIFCLEKRRVHLKFVAFLSHWLIRNGHS